MSGLSFSRRSHSSCEKRRIVSLNAASPLSVGVKKQQIDIRVRKQPASPEAASRDQGEVRGSAFQRRDDFFPKTKRQVFHQHGAPHDRSPAVAVGGKFLLDAAGLLAVQVPEFAAQGGCRCHDRVVPVRAHARNSLNRGEISHYRTPCPGRSKQAASNTLRARRKSRKSELFIVTIRIGYCALPLIRRWAAAFVSNRIPPHRSRHMRAGRD